MFVVVAVVVVVVDFLFCCCFLVFLVSFLFVCSLSPENGLVVVQYGDFLIELIQSCMRVTSVFINTGQTRPLTLSLPQPVKISVLKDTLTRLRIVHFPVL